MSPDRAELLDANRRGLFVGPLDRTATSRAVILLCLKIRSDIPATSGAVLPLFLLDPVHRFPLVCILTVSSVLLHEIVAKSHGRPFSACLKNLDVFSCSSIQHYHMESWKNVSGWGYKSLPPSGDACNELVPLYLLAYFVGMFARYSPSQWLVVICGTSSAPDTALPASAVMAVQDQSVREFSAQLGGIRRCSEHFGEKTRMVAPDRLCYIGGPGFGRHDHHPELPARHL